MGSCVILHDGGGWVRFGAAVDWLKLWFTRLGKLWCWKEDPLEVLFGVPDITWLWNVRLMFNSWRFLYLLMGTWSRFFTFNYRSQILLLLFLLFLLFMRFLRHLLLLWDLLLILCFLIAFLNLALPFWLFSGIITISLISMTFTSIFAKLACLMLLTRAYIFLFAFSSSV